MMLLKLHNRLDAEQASALRHFTGDLESVLVEARVSPAYFRRSMDGLTAAYRAALLTRKWSVLVAVLADTLDDLGERGGAPAKALSLPYRRLLAIVQENQDLLPEEMRGAEAAAYGDAGAQ
jgi:hypothetical protein